MRYPKFQGLSAEEWAKASVTERIEALNELETYLADQDGRQPCVISSMDLGESTRGQHGKDIKGIEHIDLNSELVNDPSPYQAVETLFHEDRHSHQMNVVQNPELAESPQQLSDWQMSEANGYIQPNEINYSSYRWQPTEVDANEAARACTDSLYQDTYQDNGNYPEHKAQKEKEIADAEEYGKYELGEDYKEEARKAMVDKYLTNQEIKSAEYNIPEVSTTEVDKEKEPTKVESRDVNQDLASTGESITGTGLPTTTPTGSESSGSDESESYSYGYGY